MTEVLRRFDTNKLEKRFIQDVQLTACMNPTVASVDGCI
jgi:hypothetical protein